MAIARMFPSEDADSSSHFPNYGKHFSAGTDTVLLCDGVLRNSALRVLYFDRRPSAWSAVGACGRFFALIVGAALLVACASVEEPAHAALHSTNPGRTGEKFAATIRIEGFSDPDNFRFGAAEVASFPNYLQGAFQKCVMFFHWF